MGLLRSPQPPRTDDWRSGIALATFLTRLIWLCVLPPMLLAAWLAFVSVRDQQAMRDTQALNIATDTATAIDYFIDARIRALNMLAVSPLVDDPQRWVQLYREAEAFRRSFDSHVIFADAAEPMRMLFNTRVPYGDALPNLPRPEGHAAAPIAVATGRPAVSDSFIGPISKGSLVAIVVPVLREGSVARLMLTTVETTTLHQRLMRQSLPEGWALYLLDGRGQVIAGHAPSDFDPQRDVDDSVRHAARSAVSPWSVVLMIPRAARRIPLIETSMALAAGVLGATLIGVLGGTLAGRRLGREVASLVAAPRSSAAPPEIIEIAAAHRLLDETFEKRAAAEADLRKLSRVIEQAASTVLITDEDGIIEYVNPRFTETSGYAAAEVIGQRPALLKSGHTSAEEYERLWRTIKAGHVWRGEFRNRHKNGTLYWESATITPIRDHSNRITHFAGIKEDITERKLAEAAVIRSAEQHRAVIETASDGYWVTDPEGRLRDVNNAYLRRSGYERQELLAMRIADVEAVESSVDVLAHLERVRRDGSDRFETRHRAKDGEIWPVEVSASYWPTGGLYFSFLRDIGDRKRTEVALRDMHVELEQLMKRHVASQTAAALAHDLNQPLIAIASYAEAALRLLRSGNPQPDRLQQAIEGGAQQAQRAGQVVRELLAFMRVGEVQTEPVDLNDLVSKVFARVEENLSHGFQSRLDLEPDLRPVNANRLQIEKVMANLIQNGIEAMRDAGIDPHAMTVAVRSNADGHMAQVTVCDSGPGIDEQTLHRIFDPFFTTKSQGIGMGLAISRAIIEAHGGQLWLEVGPEPGATFHFTLPFVT